MDLLPDKLPEDLSLCHELIRELLEKIRKEETLNQKLQHQLEQLLKSRYGPRADRIDPNQKLLFEEILKELNAPKEETKPKEAPSQKEKRNGKGHGRKPLPAHLPRKKIEHDIDPEDKVCSECGKEKTLIGFETSDQLEYVPASLLVLEHKYNKYACRACENGVTTADRPVMPIQKGLPGPGLLAQVVVSKYSEHLPLARQEDIFKRHGVEIPRSTQCDWMGAAADLVLPLVERMKERVLSSRVIQTDDTPVPVRDNDLPKTRPGRIWVYRGDAANSYTVYDYTPSRKRDGPMNFLSGYEGYLQADAYGGYDGIYAGSKVKEVGCWAHVRRKFVDAQSSDPLRASGAIARIRLLYAIENEAKDFSAQERKTLREAKSRPILADFEQWLMEEKGAVLPKSPMGEAISYALSNWKALLRYLEDGNLQIDNNASERDLCPIAVGRKNWMHFGSDRGGKTAAALYSLTQSAKRNGFDPFGYLCDVFDRISSLPASRIDELLPDVWKRLRESAAIEEPAAR